MVFNKRFFCINKNSNVALSQVLRKSYLHSKVKIYHFIEKGEAVTGCYSIYIKTIENLKEQIFLAHSIVIWDIKDEKLYCGY